MIRRSLCSLLLQLVALLVALPASAQLLSPGPLAAPHANLEGDQNCGRCHSSGRGVSNGKCGSCHGKVVGKGLHASAFRGPCAKCHADHRGRGFALVRFNPKSFNHGLTSFPLRGAHGKIKCRECHKSRGWLGLTTGCTSCHKDPHKKRFGNRCTGCHNESNWKSVNLKGFNHSKSRFPLRGAHAKAACVNCHGKPARYTGLDFAACTSCHKNPHGGRFSTTCQNCHSESSWHRINMKPGAHPGLSLFGGHARLGCGRCHDRGALRRPSRGAACINCHKAVHDAPFGKNCRSCHGSIRWMGLPRRIGLRAHKKTPFRLKGRHQKTKCAACHQPKLPRQKRFRGLSFERCRDCHSDPHAGRFAKRDRGECGPCHSESGFRPSSFGVAMHTTTRFALVGHHTAVPCGACHSKHKDEKQRLDWRMSTRACAKCHDNPHGNQFAKQMKKNGCATCHSAVDWHLPNIDHKSWPLTGAHASAACDRCHTPTEKDRKLGRGASYRAAPRNCEGCHQDQHRGQFRLSRPKRSCKACHNTAKFAIRSFDHARLAKYPLEGRHKTLACKQCHKKQKLKDGTAAVRYRLGFRRCRDCHADPHEEAGR